MGDLGVGASSPSRGRIEEGVRPRVGGRWGGGVGYGRLGVTTTLDFVDAVDLRLNPVGELEGVDLLAQGQQLGQTTGWVR